MNKYITFSCKWLQNYLSSLVSRCSIIPWRQHCCHQIAPGHAPFTLFLLPEPALNHYSLLPWPPSTWLPSVTFWPCSYNPTQAATCIARLPGLEAPPTAASGCCCRRVCSQLISPFSIAGCAIVLLLSTWPWSLALLTSLPSLIPPAQADQHSKVASLLAASLFPLWPLSHPSLSNQSLGLKDLVSLLFADYL